MSASPAVACLEQPSIDDHFAGHLSAGDERRMRLHLPGCAACRRHYDRHLLLASLDPEAPAVHERLATGLGMGVPRWRSVAARLHEGGKGWPGWRPWSAAGIVAAAAAIALVGTRVAQERAMPFQARGAATPGAHAFVYEAKKGQASKRVNESIAPSAELAFGYENAANKPYFMAFGVDEHRHVYWYHPGWTDPASDPASISISGGPERRLLPEAIGHDLDGTVLEVHAWFLDRPMNTKAVEVEVRAAAPGVTRLAPAGAIEEVVRLEVRR